MGLFAVHVLHFRAFCDACRQATSEVHCGGDMGQHGRYQAIDELLAAGWRHGVHRDDRRDPAWIEREGAGEWRCPRCARAIKR